MNDVIYQPKGAAREYAPLASNMYKGCVHGCEYCFGPGTMQTKREEYVAAAKPKKNYIAKLTKDAGRLKGDDREILLSFIGDPYQPAETDLRLTRRAIEILIQNELRFTILTKGGIRATRDFDLLAGYPRARFGTSLVWHDQSKAATWEPEAASVQDRIEALISAHSLGIPTWVSLEPIIEPREALKVIEDLHPYVNHWKVGKINHHKEIEDRVDWRAARKEIEELLVRLGADYYLKKSLTEWSGLAEDGDLMTSIGLISGMGPDAA